MGMDQYLYAASDLKTVRQLSWEGPWCHYLRKNYWLNARIESLHPESFIQDRCLCSTTDITDDIEGLIATTSNECWEQFQDGGCEYEIVYAMAALMWAKAQVANGWRIFYNMDS